MTETIWIMMDAQVSVPQKPDIIVQKTNVQQHVLQLLPDLRQAKDGNEMSTCQQAPLQQWKMPKLLSRTLLSDEKRKTTEI